MPKMSTEATPLRRVALNGPTMGTRWSAIGYVPPEVDVATLEADLAEVVERVDRQMSTWKAESELMQLNRTPVGVWRDIPDELAYVLAIGAGIGRDSGGRFDMAVLGPVAAWGFGPNLPAEEAKVAPRAPGGLTLELDPAQKRARRLMDVTFDLSGIAKGFGVDLLARVMEAHGIDGYLVAIAGELQAGGTQPGGIAWQVAVEAPFAGRRDVATVVEIGDCALATSGDYRHGRQEKDRWISHTIDPQTGAPVENRLSSVTVRAADCVVADAWATALMVAGEFEGPVLANKMGLDALFLVRMGDSFAAKGTGMFADLAAGGLPGAAA